MKRGQVARNLDPGKVKCARNDRVLNLELYADSFDEVKRIIDVGVQSLEA